MQKIFLTFILGALAYWPILAQTTNLQTCYKAARDHHPIQKVPNLLIQLESLQAEQVAQDKKPGLQWISKATLQTENVNFEFPIPNIEGVDLPLYNIQSYLEGTYLILDGGLSEARQQLLKDQIALQHQEVEQQLFPLYKTINQYYFAILLLQEQAEQVDLVKDNLKLQLEKLEGAFRQGVILEIEVKKLQLEILKLEQSNAEIIYQQEGAKNALAILTGLAKENFDQLEIPDPSFLPIETYENRPEFQVFQYQKQQLTGQTLMLEAQAKPKLSAFLRAGVGYPNPLNFFDVGFSPYAIGGLQFQWPLLNYNRTDRQQQIAQVQMELIDQQQAAFSQQLDLQTDQFLNQQTMLLELIQQDKVLLELQESITPQVQAQFHNGTITVNDYILQVNAELLMELQLKAHEIQLIKTQVDYTTESGNIIE